MAASTVQQCLAMALRHHQAGQRHEAETLYRQVLQREPNNALALHYLGLLAHEDGASDVAIDLMQRAIAANPRIPEFHANLGQVWMSMGKLRSAVESCRTAISLRPGFDGAHHALGRALRAMGRLEEAIASYRQVVALRPDYPEIYNDLGMVLQDRGRLGDAAGAFRKAVSLRPDFAAAYNNLGGVLQEQGRLAESIECYRKAIGLRPDAGVHSNLLLALNYVDGIDPAAIFDEHERFGRQHGESVGSSIVRHENARDPARRLKIGYLSPDFREHPVAFFMEGALASHDHQQFEVMCYAHSAHPDAVTDRLRHLADGWRDIVAMTDEQAAQQIRRDGIDILLDLAGHTGSNRLSIFALKPAPVQVTYLGYQNTTGLSAVDYRLTDVVSDPPGSSDRYYIEKLIRVPDVVACYRPPAQAPDVTPSPATRRGFVTFASFSKLQKAPPRVLELWARVLRAVEGSRMLMMAGNYADAEVREQLCQFFECRGVGCGRLDLRPPGSLAEYLAAHAEVDMILDTFPFTGHTTTCHGLWMGVPTVSLSGDSYRFRLGRSVLASVGLDHLVAETEDQYVQIAADLAQDPQRLAELRAGLRERMGRSALLDSPRFTRHLEATYRHMWETWCASAQ